jgi:hypothetical protein
MVLVGVLLTAAALYMAGMAQSQAPDPERPLAELLLQPKDIGFPDCKVHVTEWTECIQGTDDMKTAAEKVAEFLGLPTDYQEGGVTYYGVFLPPYPKSVLHGVYRYRSPEEAAARYKYLLEALHHAPVGRKTSILRQSEWVSKEARGQIIESRDSEGPIHDFVGVRGNLLIVVSIGGYELAPEAGYASAREVESYVRQALEDLLPVVLAKVAGP